MKEMLSIMVCHYIPQSASSLQGKTFMFRGSVNFQKAEAFLCVSIMYDEVMYKLSGDKSQDHKERGLECYTCSDTDRLALVIDNI